VEFWGIGGDAEADAALDGLAKCLVPGGAEGLIGEEVCKESLAIVDRVTGGGPGKYTYREVALELLAAAEGDLDRVSGDAVVAGVDVDL
jgi:hypothetical protein